MKFDSPHPSTSSRSGRRRGVSAIISTLLLIAVVVSMSLIVLAFANDGLGATAGSFAGLVSNQGRAVAENFAVEQAAFTYPGSASSSAPVVDGMSTDQTAGASTSIATVFSTATTDDVVIAYVSASDTGSNAPPSVSGVSGGGLTWNHRATAPSVSSTGNEYVPVTLTNGQTSPTPAPFQQVVTFDPASYTSYEAANLGNLRFCADEGCATPLYAWLESCSGSCSTAGSTSTSATAWVALTSSIAGNGGTLTVYMVFEPTSTNFDGVHWGEAPQLSPTYAEYDNGASVFSAYFNGDTATSSFSVYTGYALSQATGVTGPGGATINALKATGYNGANPVFAFNTPVSNQGLVVESSFSSPGSTTTAPYTGTDTGAAGLLDNAAVASVANGISSNMGYGVSYFDQDYELGGGFTADQNGQGAATAAWVYATLTYAGPTAAAWSAFVAPQLYSSTGGYTGTVNNDPLAAASNLYIGQLSDTAAGYQLTVYYNFMRARAYPPNGVMPAASLGGASTTALTLDVEEWYAVAAGAVNGVTVTATLSTPDTGATWIAVFGVSGANIASPFDSNAAVPATGSGANSVQTTMSTSNGNDMLLYGCSAAAGGMAAGFTGVYSSSYSPDQNEFVGYETVSNAQTNLVTSCGGSGTYGSEITDAVAGSSVSTYPGATLYVRNVGTVPVTIVSVYVVDQSTNAFVTQVAVDKALTVGALVSISDSSVTFDPSHGHTYSFTVTSSLGTSVTLYEAAP